MPAPSNKLTFALVTPWIVSVIVLLVMTFVHDVDTLRSLYTVAAVSTSLGVFLFGVSRWSQYGPVIPDEPAGGAPPDTRRTASVSGGPSLQASPPGDEGGR